jgi:Protein of unknown function (DUF2510)
VLSEHLLALLRNADGLGLVLYTRAHVRGNALKAEVTIYPTRTADLPQAWIADLATRASTEIAASTSALDVAADGRPSVPAPRLPPPSGWYPDPAGPGLRWWDGSAWTAHTAPIGQRL